MGKYSGALFSLQRVGVGGGVGGRGVEAICVQPHQQWHGYQDNFLEILEKQRMHTSPPPPPPYVVLETVPSTKTECDYLNGWVKKTVTYAKISPIMGNTKEEEEEGGGGEQQHQQQKKKQQQPNNNNNKKPHQKQVIKETKTKQKQKRKKKQTPNPKTPVPIAV